MLENIYIKFMCEFEYGWPNSFQEICTEEWPFFLNQKVMFADFF